MKYFWHFPVAENVCFSLVVVDGYIQPRSQGLRYDCSYVAAKTLGTKLGDINKRWFISSFLLDMRLISFVPM